MEFKTFPHPTRPSTYANLTSFKYATAITQHSEPIVHHISEPSTSTSYQQQQRDDEDELFCELTRILFECLEIVDSVPKCLLLRKIFLELEKESGMENFIVEKLKHSQVKAISDFLERYQEERFTNQVDEDEVKYISRGFKQDLMDVEYSHKLERFKVKTINIEGGVIKK